MNIQSLKFNNPENTSLTLTTNDGVYYVPWPCENHFNNFIQKAISDGMIIEEHKTSSEIEIDSLQTQIKEVEATRDINLVAGCTFNGNLYHSDDRFVSELMMLIQGYQLGIFPVEMTHSIRTKDNIIVTLTKDEIVQLTLMIGQYRQSVYQSSWTAKDALRTQIEALLAA